MPDHVAALVLPLAGSRGHKGDRYATDFHGTVIPPTAVQEVISIIARGPTTCLIL
jgi:hypothetical protein